MWSRWLCGVCVCVCVCVGGESVCSGFGGVGVQRVALWFVCVCVLLCVEETE